MSNIKSLVGVPAIKAALVAKDYPRTETRKAFSLLLATDIVGLNAWIMQNLDAYFVTVGREEAIAMLGLEECNPTQEAPTIVLGKKAYIARNNPHNRPWAKGIVQEYVADMLAGLWSLGDALYWGADGFILSAQHRLLAIMLASETDPTIRIPFLLLVGLPPQLADIIDRQRRRTTKDITFRGDDIPMELLAEGVAEPTPESYPKQKATLSAIYTTARGYVLSRIKGKNVHSSGSTNSEREIMQCQERFGKVTLESGVVVNALVYLCWQVYQASLADTGKVRDAFVKFPHAQLVTALVLYSNRNNTDPTDLEIDFEFSERFLEALQESTDKSGPMERAIAGMVKAKSDIGKASIPRENAMHAIVGMVGQFAEHSSVVDNPYPSKRVQKKEGYACFGGVDIGYVEVSKKKKED